MGRRDADADPVRADRVYDGLGDLDREAGTVLGQSAVLVGALIGRRGQELVEQVAVGRVQLDSVEAGLDGRLGGVDELLDDSGDLVGLERAGHDRVLGAFNRDGRLVELDRARGNGLEAVLVVGVGDPSNVHQLDDDVAAAGVNLIGDSAPALDLLRRMDARGVQVTLADRTGLGALGHDQAGAGPLAVVGHGDVLRDHALAGPVAGQRRHDEPLREVPVADLDGFEHVSHTYSSEVRKPAPTAGAFMFNHLEPR